MLEGNRKEFMFSNILQWKNAGYTGKGVHIGVVDNDALSGAWMLGGKGHDIIVDEEVENSHGLNVAQTIHQIADESELYGMPTGISSWKPWDGNYTKGMQEAIKKGLHIINASQRSEKFREIDKQAYESGITLISSAGNYGQDNNNTLGSLARSPYWLAIGAVHEDDGRYELAHYTSIGKELDCVSFSNIEVNYLNGRTHKVTGTSFSSPFTVGMLALWFEMFYEYFNRFPTPKESEQFIKDNTVDYVDDDAKEGFDIYSGYGLFVLPNVGELRDKYEKIRNGKESDTNNSDSNWKATLGRTAVWQLHEKGLINNPEQWENKMLEDTENWLFFEMIKRISK